MSSYTCPSELPGHLLHDIFTVVLSAPRVLVGVPLRPLVTQWFALRLTCRAWAAALQDVQLAADLADCSPQALAWLASLPTKVLRIGSFLLSSHNGRLQLMRQRRSYSAPTLAAAAAAAADPGPGPPVIHGREARLQDLTAMELMETLGFISCVEPRAGALAMAMADFSQLQVGPRFGTA